MVLPECLYSIIYCFGHKHNSKSQEESHKLVSSSQSVNIFGSKSRDVPFTIPLCRALPSSLDVKLLENEENTSLPPARSRSSTIDAFSQIDLVDLDLKLYTTFDACDTELYPPNHMGRLWCSMNYIEAEEQLHIKLIKARNFLPNVALSKDYFIRVYLLPDEKRFMQSKKRKHQSDPELDDIYTFQVPGSQICERIIKIVVYQGSSTRKFLPVANSFIQLNNPINYDKSVWTDLLPFFKGDAEPNASKILVSLYYDTTRQRLFVVVFKCIQLGLEQPSDVVLKIELITQNKRAKKQRSLSVKQCLSEAEFNELFKFSLGLTKIQTSCISICLKTANSSEKSSEKFLGRVVLGGYMLAVGKELNHWQTMADKTDEQHTQWHDLCM